MKKNTPCAALSALLILVLLLTACGKNAASSPEASPAEPGASPSPAAESPEAASSIPPSPAPTAYHSGVKTDFSVLTPYAPMAEIYTRLKDGPLPELNPAGNYGTLMPYARISHYGNGGYLAFHKYGLATIRGMIVTDPVYDRAYQGSHYDYENFKNVFVPAYDLVMLPDVIDENDIWNSERHAVCALDGSWITAFNYTSVHFTDKVILCMRDYEKNDVDILDYRGKLLLNTVSLDCFSRLPPHSGYTLLNGYGEGLIALQLIGGETVYIDALTGKERFRTDLQGEAFFGGYARFMENSLMGFMDKDFNIVIEPQFVYADVFIDGKSVVQLEDGTSAVIGTDGTVLFDSPYSISRWSQSIYSVFGGDSYTAFYDSRFNRLTSDGSQIMPLNDAWYYYEANGGVVLKNGSTEYRISGIDSVGGVAGGLVTYYGNDSGGWKEGVKTLDGKDVVPLTERCSIYLVTSTKTDEVFIIKSMYGTSAASQSFEILNMQGQIVLSGPGYVTYSPPLDLFVITSAQYFGCADTCGNYVFRISLLQYVPD